MELTELSPPLVLAHIEEKQVCLGHKDFFCEYKNREVAKKYGFSWEIETKKNPLFKDASFSVDTISRKVHKLYKQYIHIDDAIDCNHYKIDTIKNIYKLQLQVEEVTHLVPILEK